MNADKLREWVRLRREIAGKAKAKPHFNAGMESPDFNRKKEREIQMENVGNSLAFMIDAASSAPKYAEIVEVLLSGLEQVRIYADNEEVEMTCIDAISKAAAIVGDV